MLSNMIGVLASGLRVDEASVTWLARKLQDAELLPADSENDEVLPLHAARLLVALLAAARPIDAAAAVAAYEQAMLRVPVPEPAPTGLCCNFVAALAQLIEAAATDPAARLPAQIRAWRSPGEPLGQLVDMPARSTSREQRLTLVYGCHGDGGASLEVYGTAPGAVLQTVADLLRLTEDTRQRRGPKRPRPWSALPHCRARHDSRSAGDPAARA